jgi:hypothetical protein
LKLERNIAYLVEEDRAAVGKFETANALPNGARKRALLVTEQLAFKQAVAAQFTFTRVFSRRALRL